MSDPKCQRRYTHARPRRTAQFCSYSRFQRTDNHVATPAHRRSLRRTTSSNVISNAIRSWRTRAAIYGRDIWPRLLRTSILKQHGSNPPLLEPRSATMHASRSWRRPIGFQCRVYKILTETGQGSQLMAGIQAGLLTEQNRGDEPSSVTLCCTAGLRSSLHRR